MGDKSAIEWTDATWNPLRGCVKISPGCKNCYAEAFAERWRGVPGHPFEQGFDLRLVPEKIDEPLRWRRPRRIFVNSMSDLFQVGVPDHFVRNVFNVMDMAPRHTYQVLTKRAERMRDITSAMPRALVVQPHIWLGVSVEDRKYGLPRIDLLRETPAAVRFLSVEPLLQDLGTLDLTGIDWVIVGGESGRGARQFQVEWARSIRDQCRAAGVAVFIKQLGAAVWDRNDVGFDGETAGEWPEAARVEGHTYAQGQLVRVRLKHKKGGDSDEWPEDLRVQEFPGGAR